MKPIVLLPLVFIPSVEYLLWLREGAGVTAHEPYGKQSFRNRTAIASAQGVQYLSLPVAKHTFPPPITQEIEITEHGGWRRTMFSALKTSYHNTPYWEHYEPEIKALLNYPTTLLTTYCYQWLCWLCTEVRLPIPKLQTPQSNTPVYREIANRHHTCTIPLQRYWQVFEQQQGFIPNLSGLDLLLHLGPEATLYLRSQAPPPHPHS